MSYEDEILVRGCFLCGCPLQINRTVKVGDSFLCHDCAKKFFELTRQFVRKDVFKD